MLTVLGVLFIAGTPGVPEGREELLAGGKGVTDGPCQNPLQSVPSSKLNSQHSLKSVLSSCHNYLLAFQLLRWKAGPVQSQVWDFGIQSCFLALVGFFFCLFVFWR